MTKLFLAAIALCATGLSEAQEAGRVLSSTPVVQQVGVPRQVCTTEQVEVQTQNSGAGATLGAIAGGALGNASGNGAGRAAATVIGVIGGAMVGNRIEGTPDLQIQNVQRCGTQTFFENRTVAYNVVYEYAGRQYSVQMPNDPGPTIALQVSPVGANAQAAAPPPDIVLQAPVYVQQPAQIVFTRQFYPYYYPAPQFAPLSLNFGFGFRNGHGGHGGHGHWR